MILDLIGGALSFKRLLPFDSAEFRIPVRSVTIIGPLKRQRGNRVRVGDSNALNLGLCLALFS